VTTEYRTVLAPGVSREQFQDLALSSEWQLHTVVEPTAERPYEEVWSIDGGTSSAHYVEDDRLGVAIVTTMGDRAAGLAELVRRGLSALTPAEVLVWAYAVGTEGDPGERVRSLGYLAAVAPDEPADAFVAVLEDALRDPRAKVRRAALFTCLYLSWLELVPLVEAVRDGDPDETTRDNATRVLEAIHRYRNPTS
jgi:hypothetical protein